MNETTILRATILTYPIGVLGAAIALVLLARLKTRLELSRAKHPSLAGHSRWSRRFAALVPFYEFDETKFFRADNAPDSVSEQRRNGFKRLAALYGERFPKTAQQTGEVQGGISDLQFIGSYRVPFQFSRYVREHLKAGSFVQSSSGVTITDLDGNIFYDVAGSYGVNVFGYDFYKRCIARAVEHAGELGPVLGAYDTAVAYNVQRLREISGLDEVSFHMSGTEAVMQAVRLARLCSPRQFARGTCITAATPNGSPRCRR